MVVVQDLNTWKDTRNKVSHLFLHINSVWAHVTIIYIYIHMNKYKYVAVIFSCIKFELTSIKQKTLNKKGSLIKVPML